MSKPLVILALILVFAAGFLSGYRVTMTNLTPELVSENTLAITVFNQTDIYDI